MIFFPILYTVSRETDFNIKFEFDVIFLDKFII